jgi:Xaa-Pro aminopeptidase
VKGFFNKEFFKANRRALKDLVPNNAPIVVSANGSVQRNGDIVQPYRQDSSFWYLTGIEIPGCLLVIDGNEEYIVANMPNKIQAFFEGDFESEKYSNISGINDYEFDEDGEERLRATLLKHTSVATFTYEEMYESFHRMYINPAKYFLPEKLKRLRSEIEVIDIRKQMAALRMIKKPEEIDAIKKAVDITSEAFEYIRQHKSEYKNEAEIAADVTKIFMNNHVVHAYEPIVSADKNSCMIHYQANNSKLKKSSMLLMDIGAEFSNYSADITRMLALDKLTKRQFEIIDAVAEVQNYAFSAIKPGVVMKDFELDVEEYMGKVLKKLKLIKNTERHEIHEYFPYLTSHFLGLDTHDIGDYAAVLQPGMVITVEPGIHIKEEGFGVRLEDDVVVTENGIDNLSGHLPKIII